MYLEYLYEQRHLQKKKKKQEKERKKTATVAPLRGNGHVNIISYKTYVFMGHFSLIYVFIFILYKKNREPYKKGHFILRSRGGGTFAIAPGVRGTGVQGYGKGAPPSAAPSHSGGKRIRVVLSLLRTSPAFTGW